MKGSGHDVGKGFRISAGCFFFLSCLDIHYQPLNGDPLLKPIRDVSIPGAGIRNNRVCKDT